MHCFNMIWKKKKCLFNSFKGVFLYICFYDLTNKCNILILVDFECILMVIKLIVDTLIDVLRVWNIFELILPIDNNAADIIIYFITRYILLLLLLT